KTASSDSSIGFNVTSKVASLGNKYCNGGAKASKGADKPVPQLDNYVKDEDGQPRAMEEDQPTDFSLRYTEEGEEVKVGSKGAPEGQPQTTRNGFFEQRSVHDDSVLTFCTEGTPYNFSTATSLSDLREIDRSTTDGSKDLKMTDLDEDEDFDLDIENLNDLDLELTPKEEKRLVKPVPTRLAPTGDNPVTYCVEGTPVSLSRISSVSSISSEEINDRIDKELLEDDDDDDTEQICLPDKGGGEREGGQTSHQTSAFNPVEAQPQADAHLQVCDQTPLMFSRATSVSSLSSFEIQSIHDDRSSIVSDFSRLASGVVSPSDLPDSPSQTIPSSPKRGRPPQPPNHIPRNVQPSGEIHLVLFRSAVFSTELLLLAVQSIHGF
ncbi:UNVERIFIED_CONTAM: hypothetical protein GTU68_017435, partial [Idotea baltica]|nr:hypothetical protein [Idotea baltica]